MDLVVPRQARILAWALLLASPLAPFIGTPAAFVGLIPAMAGVATIIFGVDFVSRASKAAPTLVLTRNIRGYSFITIGATLIFFGMQLAANG